MRGAVATEKGMTIGQFARRAGVSPDTARFYERLGLIRPQRLENNYRVYGPGELARIDFITKVRASGFSLSEVRKFVKMLSAGKRQCKDYAASARRKLDQLDEQIRVLQKARQELRRALRTCVGEAEDCVLAPPV